MNYVLRWYQQEAKDSIYDYFRRNPTGHPCVTLPTGSGKTPLLASLCADAIGWGVRVCVVAHVKELVEQAYNTLSGMLGGTEKVGLYSAGLNRRDTTQPIICAGIQSVYKRAKEFSSSKGNIFEQKELKPFDLLIVDEAHLIPDSGDGMYRQFIDELLKINPNMRVIGLTATPYRLKSGLIYKHVTNQAIHSNLIFDENVYEASIKLLITQKYLCPIKSYGGSVKADLSKVSVRAGEYVASEMSKAFEEVIVPALSDAIARCDRFMRKSVLVFATDVKTGEHITKLLKKSGERAAMICDKTPADERAQILKDFKKGLIRYLVNVNVLTTGFDAPNVDAVVLLRATKSPGLYYQMVGRGFRLHQDKSYCLVLDYGANVETHGPVDNLKPPQLKQKGDGEAPLKECPECGIYMHAAIKFCPECNFEFTQESIDLLLEASRAGVLSGEKTNVELNVIKTEYEVNYKKIKTNNGRWEADYNLPRSLRVKYYTDFINHYDQVIPVENEKGRGIGSNWWKDRCPLVKFPETAEEASVLCNAGAIPQTTKISIVITAGQAWVDFIGYEYDKPLDSDAIEKVLDEAHKREEALNVEMIENAVVAGVGADWFDDDDIPF